MPWIATCSDVIRQSDSRPGPRRRCRLPGPRRSGRRARPASPARRPASRGRARRGSGSRPARALSRPRCASCRRQPDAPARSTSSSWTSVAAKVALADRLDADEGVRRHGRRGIERAVAQPEEVVEQRRISALRTGQDYRSRRTWRRRPRMVASRSASTTWSATASWTSTSEKPVVDLDRADDAARDVRLVGDGADQVARAQPGSTTAADEQADPAAVRDRPDRRLPGRDRDRPGRGRAPGPDRGPRPGPAAGARCRGGGPGDERRRRELDLVGLGRTRALDQADRRERDVDQVELVGQRLDDAPEAVVAVARGAPRAGSRGGSRSAARAGRRRSAGGRSRAWCGSPPRCCAAAGARAARRA